MNHTATAHKICDLRWNHQSSGNFENFQKFFGENLKKKLKISPKLEIEKKKTIAFPL